MTPIQKAQELFSEGYDICGNREGAKGVALSIIWEVLYLLDTQCQGYQAKMLEFWGKVKEEVKTF